MKRKPSMDWWPEPEEAPKPDKPSVRMEGDPDWTEIGDKVIKFESDDHYGTQYMPADVEPSPLNPQDLEDCSAITFTLQARSLTPTQIRELMVKSEQTLMSMRGGDLYLVKDRRRQTPAIVSKGGGKPWYSRRSKRR